jgi:phosphonate transport system ATP-binding protein
MTSAVELTDVCVRRGVAPALDRVTVRIAPGERVAVVGPSGAGKTTLLSVANTSLAPTTGAIRVLDRDPLLLDTAARRHLRTRIGTMSQRPPLAGPLRVVHQVNAGRLGQWSSMQAMWSLLRPRGVDKTREVLAMLGIEHTLWRRADELSGGELQRVALARLLVQDAELVLADEPVASLDPARSAEVLQLLTQVVAPGRTVICSLHQFDLAVAMFERVIGLRDGRIVFDLPANEVTADHAAVLYELADRPAP